MRLVRRMAAYEMIVLMAVMILAGCGKESYDADENTVFILKKGRIVSTDVGELPQQQYDKGEFEAYVNDTIKSYTDQYGEGTVELDALSVEEDTAKVTLQYNTAMDYSRFTGVELFAGSVSEALADGYDFDVDFVEAATGRECALSEIIDNGTLHVAIIKGNVSLQVYDDIVYYSREHVRITGKQTLSIDPANDLEETTESVPLESVSETEDFLSFGYEETEGGEDLGVDEDELLFGTEEEQMTFDFAEQSDSGGEDSGDRKELSTVYTYVVFE